MRVRWRINFFALYLDGIYGNVAHLAECAESIDDGLRILSVDAKILLIG